MRARSPAFRPFDASAFRVVPIRRTADIDRNRRCAALRQIPRPKSSIRQHAVSDRNQKWPVSSDPGQMCVRGSPEIAAQLAPQSARVRLRMFRIRPVALPLAAAALPLAYAIGRSPAGSGRYLTCRGTRRRSRHLPRLAGGDAAAISPDIARPLKAVYPPYHHADLRGARSAPSNAGKQMAASGITQCGATSTPRTSWHGTRAGALARMHRQVTPHPHAGLRSAAHATANVAADEPALFAFCTY